MGVVLARSRYFLPMLMLLGAACTEGSLSPAWGPAFAPTELPTPHAQVTPVPPPLGTGDGHSGALVVSGTQVVNRCLPAGGGVGTMSVTVDDPAGLRVGDAVLLLQNDYTVGTDGVMATVTNGNGAGGWMINRVTGFVGSNSSTDVLLERPLTQDFVRFLAIASMVCSIPEYTDVTIPAGAKIAAVPLGVAGGVAAFFATGTVTLDGEVDADATGYPGGVISTNYGGANVTLDDTSTGHGGGKGGGLDVRSQYTHGRGAWANAGGGGNAHNAGGGGGGGGGAGGWGGKQSSASGENAGTRGEPGGGVQAPILGMLTWGGGGGGGQQNNSVATAGGAGGGIVLLSVGVLEGSGSIHARGGTAADSPGPSLDGAGGGGAGGSIAIWAEAESIGFAGSIAARGGDGGSIDCTPNASDLHGPGGGGGGGRVLVSGIPPGLSVDVTHGHAGVNQTTVPDARGATDGAEGTIESP